MQIQDWGDLRFLLALHRHGTLTEAARVLGVDQTTVTRRLRALETATGSELYEKFRRGAVMTRVGEELVATAERLEIEMLDLEARVLGGQAHMEGPVRITMSSLHAVELVPECEAFAKAYPRINLEVVVADRVHSLSRREADIALRIVMKAKLPDHFVGRKIGPCASAVFGVPAMKALAWAQRPWIGRVDSEQWADIEIYRDRFEQGPWCFKTDDTWTVVEAVRAGAGVTVLACGCPRATRGLVALTEPKVFGTMWMLTHPELRRSPRIRATLDFWYAALEKRAQGFSGASVEPEPEP